MQNLAEVISTYVRETRRLEGLPSSTETTFYPDLKLLLSAALKSERLPFDVITGTSETGGRRRDMPDFVLGDSSEFVGVYGEVKRADTPLDKLAISTEQNDQIGRYLSQTGVVLLCNVRAIGLLTCDPMFKREAGKPVSPAKRVLEKSVDVWSAVSGKSGAKQKVDAEAIDELISIITRAVTDLARIGSPADLAKILARQARDAKAALPEDLRPVKPLLDDYRQALGLAFDIDDEKGRASSGRHWSSRFFTPSSRRGYCGTRMPTRPPLSRSITRTIICRSRFSKRSCTISGTRRGSGTSGSMFI